MKNRMNGCCCDDSISECVICGASKSACFYEAQANHIQLLSVTHPDEGKTDFASQGRLLGTFELASEEAEVHVIFDYLNEDYYFGVRFKQTEDETEVDIEIYQVVLGSRTTLASRVVWVEQDVNLWPGDFCVAWAPNRITVTVTYLGNAGGTLVVSKPSDNKSGKVGVLHIGPSIASVISYSRGPGEITDEGACPGCPELSSGTPCTCCPDGISATWLVDTTGFSLVNGDMHHCDTLNDKLFILDRTEASCTASHTQVIFLSACFGVYNTALSIVLTVFSLGAGACSLRVTFEVTPITPSNVDLGDCEFSRVLATYEKTVSSDGLGVLCSGEHTLSLVNSNLSVFSRCGGSLPNEIIVGSV